MAETRPRFKDILVDRSPPLSDADIDAFLSKVLLANRIDVQLSNACSKLFSLISSGPRRVCQYQVNLLCYMIATPGRNIESHCIILDLTLS